MKKIGRNDLCPCGSGKKHKLCCLRKGTVQAANPRSKEVSIPKELQTAFEHYQAGRLAQAEAIYQKILQVDPNQPDALHLLGLHAHQAGKIELAVTLISKAIMAAPGFCVFRTNVTDVSGRT